jgi:hypothetical protein
MSLTRICCLLTLVAGCGHESRSHDSDSAFAQVQERGEKVMGVDQYISRHVFESLPDGGRIVLDWPDAAEPGSDHPASHARGGGRLRARRLLQAVCGACDGGPRHRRNVGIQEPHAVSGCRSASGSRSAHHDDRLRRGSRGTQVSRVPATRPSRRRTLAHYLRVSFGAQSGGSNCTFPPPNAFPIQLKMLGPAVPPAYASPSA